jgi:hypothetical protein
MADQQMRTHIKDLYFQGQSPFTVLPNRRRQSAGNAMTHTDYVTINTNSGRKPLTASSLKLTAG